MILLTCILLEEHANNILALSPYHIPGMQVSVIPMHFFLILEI